MLNISPFYFLVSFAVGIFVVYIMTPPPDVVLKFPSPYNAGKVTYMDKSNTCYQYEAQSVECGSQTKPQPIYEDFGGRRPK